MRRRDFLAGALALAAKPSNAQPRRQILLVHGVLGFNKFANVSYFNRVRSCFQNCDFIEPQIDPVGSIVDRGQQLADKLSTCFGKNGCGKIHIVAHSMGGLDVRYLTSAKGLKKASWFASVTTISTPHQGSPLADIIQNPKSLSIMDFGPLDVLTTPDYWAAFFKTLGKPSFSLKDLLVPGGLTTIRGQIRDYIKEALASPADAFKNLTTDYVQKQFNPMYPDYGGLPLRSYAGISTPKETMSYELYGPWAILKSISGDISGDNDGVVPKSSSSYLPNSPTVPADHFEEVGLARFFDGSLGTKQHFDVCNLYRSIDQWQATIA
jgi:triacylglycerol lipase